MELDEVEAVALAVDDPEPGRILVRHAAEIERCRRAVVLAAVRKRLEVEPAARCRVSERLVGALNRSTSPNAGDWLNAASSRKALVMLEVSFMFLSPARGRGEERGH